MDESRDETRESAAGDESTRESDMKMCRIRGWCDVVLYRYQENAMENGATVTSGNKRKVTEGGRSPTCSLRVHRDGGCGCAGRGG